MVGNKDSTNLHKDTIRNDRCVVPVEWNIEK
jgi:hypothetical protein